MFAPQLLDHFENPRNAGEVAAPDASVERENPACGDVLRISLRREGERIAEIRFLAQGCVAAIVMVTVFPASLPAVVAVAAVDVTV